MGHMTLISEEVVKLFERYPEEIYSVVQSQIPQPAWDNYVSTTLRETRERDSSPLGGGVVYAPPDTTSSTLNPLSDEDDEFPSAGSRASRALQSGAQVSSPGTKGKGKQEGSDSEMEATDRVSPLPFFL